MMRALRSGDHQSYEHALGKLPELPWEVKDEYVPVVLRLTPRRPKTSWSEAREPRIQGENVDPLFRILSAGVKVYKAPYDTKTNSPLHCVGGANMKDLIDVPFVPRWALAVDPDVKKMQKIKDDIIEQKAELALEAIKKVWG